jgi:hypothetical protein
MEIWIAVAFHPGHSDAEDALRFIHYFGLKSATPRGRWLTDRPVDLWPGHSRCTRPLRMQPIGKVAKFGARCNMLQAGVRGRLLFRSTRGG